MSAIAHDAASGATRATGPGTLSWTHTPVGTPKGVVVATASQSGSATAISGVTYGGVAMTGPIESQTNSGNIRVMIWFLGSGIPTGAQTVAATNAVAADADAACFTVTATHDTYVHDSGGATSTGTAAAVPLTIAEQSQVYGVMMSQANDVGAHSADSGYTDASEEDFGTRTASWTRRDAVTSTDATISWTITSSQDWSAVAVAVAVLPAFAPDIQFVH